MNKLISPLLAAGLAASGLVAPLAVSAAEDLNYTWVQGGLAFYPGFDNQDLFGLDARGSFLITDNVFAFGGAKWLSDDLDRNEYHLGAGYRYPLGSSIDVYGGVSLERQDIESRAVTTGGATLAKFSDHDTSLGVRGGARYRLTDSFELGGEARWIFGDFDYFGVTGLAQYFLTDRVGLVGEVDIWDGEMGVIGSARYNF